MLTHVYVVWVPKAQWGDGSGPLAYFGTLKDAAAYVRDERRRAIDDATMIDDAFAAAESRGIARDYEDACSVLGWPFTITSYSVACEPIGAVLDTADVPPDVLADDDALLDYLNSET